MAEITKDEFSIPDKYFESHFGDNKALCFLREQMDGDRLVLLYLEMAMAAMPHKGVVPNDKVDELFKQYFGLSARRYANAFMAYEHEKLVKIDKNGHVVITEIAREFESK